MDHRAQHGKGFKAGADGEVVYGINPVKELLKAGKREIRCIYLLENKTGLIKEIEPYIEKKRTKVSSANKQSLDKICSTSLHQGIAAITSPYLFTPFDSIVVKKNNTGKSLILMLDEITDPMNFGSITRSAFLFGVDGIIIQEKHSCPVSAAVCKASAGAVEHISITKVVNLVYTVQKLKEEGYWFYGTEANASESFDRISYSDKSVLVIGSEGKGIRKLLRGNCDILIKIPTNEKMDSLNVSVATGIILSHLFLKSNNP